MINAFLQQEDIADSQYTIRCDLPRAELIDSIVTVPLAEVGRTLADLVSILPVLDVSEAPAIIEVRRVK